MAFCLQERNNQSEDCFFSSASFFASQTWICASGPVSGNWVKRLYSTLFGDLVRKELTLGSIEVCLLPPVGNIAEGFLDISVKRARGETQIFKFVAGRLRRHGIGGK